MSSTQPRIAIPEPTSADLAYNQRSWPLYAHAVESAGGIAVAVPVKEPQATLARIASSCSGILLPGSGADLDPEKYGQQPQPKCGPKDPAREAADEILLQEAFNLHKPVLGICYGLQSLNVWRNGTLVQHLPDAAPGEPNTPQLAVNHRPGREVQRAHPVLLARSSRLAQILCTAEETEIQGDALRLYVNSSHHQAVAQAGDYLRVVATSPGDGCIEGLEGGAEHFVLGVQWHPERTYDTNSASRALFSAFVREARDWRPRPIHDSIAGLDR